MMDTISQQALLEPDENDTRPPEGGEYFQSRGIGLERGMQCFVCSARSRANMNNIAAFVHTKAAGERIVAMFAQEAQIALLDYREHDPAWIQVKIAACDNHAGLLEKLHSSCGDGRITPVRIKLVSIPRKRQ